MMDDNSRKLIMLWNELDEAQRKLANIILPLLGHLEVDEELAQTLSLAEEAIRRHLNSHKLQARRVSQ